MAQGILMGFTGQAGAGKTTAVRLLKEHIGPKAVELSFAAPLKAFVRESFGWTHEHTDGPLKEVEDPRYRRDKAAALFGGPKCLTPRYALQTLGTDWGRKAYPEVWVQQCLRKAEVLRQQGYAVLIGDVRFPNEGDFIQWAGGFMVRINKTERARDSQYSAHESEALVQTIRVDCEIDNDYGLDHLTNLVIATYEAFAGSQERFHER